ncbi:hypothetical protein SCLCIDRAFT_26438 [Scleroderma citrinum Foug A]|uniref:Uncharacterized protein n=1 Tax=Scleroderma citrinum Foug A TaxID=1036808 RepID=A0A0C3DJ72_9AGAM|nr:hypothetical protein SCLCIDRAFT_26438 [Scleroderma citrinum Foug A]
MGVCLTAYYLHLHYLELSELAAEDEADRAAIAAYLPTLTPGFTRATIVEMWSQLWILYQAAPAHPLDDRGRFIPWYRGHVHYSKPMMHVSLHIPSPDTVWALPYRYHMMPGRDQRMPEHNNSMMNFLNVRDSVPRGMREDENENERIKRAERVNADRRIIRVGNRRMRNPNYRGSPPPYRRHTEHTRHLNETARRINRRADTLREPVPSPLEACGLSGARHLDRVPDEFHGGSPLQVVIPAYRSEQQDAPLPCIQNSHLAPEEGQVLVCAHGLAPVYPENPRVHWLFNGTYTLPSAKLHCYSMPHTRANFIGEDPCVLTYEDLALATVPAFWIDASPEVYQPASQWWHPWYSVAQFSGAVLSLRDWNDWLEINFRYIWKNGSRREQILVPAMLESEGNLFEEQQDLWCTNTTLCCLNLADYFEGEFFPYQTTPVWPTPVWPTSSDRCNDIVHIIESHTAGDKSEDVDTVYDA